jgi:outer membrane protein assembly factor BamB
MESNSSPILYQSKIFAASTEKFICLNSQNGKEVWSIPLKNSGYSIDPSPILITSKGEVIYPSISGERQ